MTWFAKGLTKDELSKEYKALARKYHPDVSREPGAGEKMAQINAEYDKYYTELQSKASGYNADNIRDIYKRAREERSVILAFLKRDKEDGDGSSWFMLDYYGKISSVGPTWDGFHGGFALCNLVTTFKEPGWLAGHVPGSGNLPNGIKSRKVERLSATITCPTYADMYFGSLYGEFGSESTQLSLTDIGERATLYTEDKYALFSTKQYGDVWIKWASDYSRFVRGHQRYAYMMVNGRLMRTPFDLKPDYMKYMEDVKGTDFGYLAFQDCTAKEFANTHDVDYTPDLAPVVGCRAMSRDSHDAELLWIDDPVVAHFARLGVVRFFCAKSNYKMRYGTFSGDTLYKNLHLIGIEEAETIQDFLDDLNQKFDDWTCGLVKKGKIRIRV